MKGGFVPRRPCATTRISLRRSTYCRNVEIEGFEDPGLVDDLLDQAIRHLQDARSATGLDEKRERLGLAVRAATRLWADLHPTFTGDAWYPISHLLQQHWPAIGDHMQWSYLQADGAGPEFDAPGDRAAQLCEQLAHEPLLSGKELLHSNVIAWVADRHPGAALIALGDWARVDPGRPSAATDREVRHLDLVVHLADHGPLVIENKVFSPPDESQLERYTEALVKLPKSYPPSTAFVLLSLGSPGWSEREIGGRLWTHRTYAELGNALLDASETFTEPSDQYQRHVLHRYARSLLALDELAQLVDVGGPTSTIALPPDLAAPLEGIRLRQGFAKVRAHGAARTIGIETGTTLVVGYSKGEPLLEWLANVPDSEDTIGWQLQGRQWRLAVRVGSTDHGYGRSAADRARRERYVEERYGGWFENQQADASLGAGSPQGSWGAFAPDFVYRHRPAPQDITVGALTTLHRGCLDRFRSMFGALPHRSATQPSLAAVRNNAANQQGET